jgi:hypothetical protein
MEDDDKLILLKTTRLPGPLPQAPLKTSAISAMVGCKQRFAAPTDQDHSAYHLQSRRDSDFGVSFPVLTKKISELSKMFAGSSPKGYAA